MDDDLVWRAELVAEVISGTFRPSVLVACDVGDSPSFVVVGIESASVVALVGTDAETEAVLAPGAPLLVNVGNSPEKKLPCCPSVRE
jgi:hypothetical protein